MVRGLWIWKKKGWPIIQQVGSETWKISIQITLISLSPGVVLEEHRAQAAGYLVISCWFVLEPKSSVNVGACSHGSLSHVTITDHIASAKKAVGKPHKLRFFFSRFVMLSGSFKMFPCKIVPRLNPVANPLWQLNSFINWMLRSSRKTSALVGAGAGVSVWGCACVGFFIMFLCDVRLWKCFNLMGYWFLSPLHNIPFLPAYLYCGIWPIQKYILPQSMTTVADKSIFSWYLALKECLRLDSGASETVHLRALATFGHSDP